MFGMVAVADARCLREPHLGGLGVAASNIDVAIIATRIAGIGRQDLDSVRGCARLAMALESAFSSVAAWAGAAGTVGRKRGPFSLPQADRNNAAYRHFMRYLVYLRMA